MFLLIPPHFGVRFFKPPPQDVWRMPRATCHYPDTLSLPRRYVITPKG